MQALQRILLRLAWPLSKVYRRLFRTVGVRVVVTHAGSVLLVRHSYGPGSWNLPGGRVDRGESPAEAAVREVREEVGVAVGAVVPVGSGGPVPGPGRGVVYVFRGETQDAAFQVDGVEIIEGRWFPLGALPEDLNPRAADILSA